MTHSDWPFRGNPIQPRAASAPPLGRVGEPRVHLILPLLLELGALHSPLDISGLQCPQTSSSQSLPHLNPQQALPSSCSGQKPRSRPPPPATTPATGSAVRTDLKSDDSSPSPLGLWSALGLNLLLIYLPSEAGTGTRSRNICLVSLRSQHY